MLVRKGTTGSAGALGSGFFFFFFFSFLLPIPTHSGSGRGAAAAVAASVSDRCAHHACSRGFSATIWKRRGFANHDVDSPCGDVKMESTGSGKALLLVNTAVRWDRS